MYLETWTFFVQRGSSGVASTWCITHVHTRSHGCYRAPGRVQNDFSFAAHMNRQRLSTDRTIFRCFVHHVRTYQRKIVRSSLCTTAKNRAIVAVHNSEKSCDR